MEPIFALSSPMSRGDYVDVDSARLLECSDDEDEHLQHGDSAPCVQIRRLVSGFAGGRRRRRLMIPLVAPQLVVDESGYGQTGPTETFVFSGFMGDVHP